MTLVIILLSVITLGWVWAIVEMRKAPSETDVWHPMTLLMDADPATRAEILRRYPEIRESWQMGDTPADFRRKYPDTATMLSHRYRALELATAAVQPAEPMLEVLEPAE